MRIKPDGAEAARIDHKDILVLRPGEIAGDGGVDGPRLEPREQSFVPWSVIRKVRGREVVVDQQGRIRRIRFPQFGAEHLVIAGPRLRIRVRSELNLMAIPGSGMTGTAPPIIGWQDFGGLDQPIGFVRREIRLKIWLRRLELLGVLRTFPTGVAQRSREVREDEPLEIRVILAVVEKLRAAHGRLIARDARAFVLDSSNHAER